MFLSIATKSPDKHTCSEVWAQFSDRQNMHLKLGMEITGTTCKEVFFFVVVLFFPQIGGSVVWVKLRGF